MENVLISFESDTSGLKPGVDALQQLGKTDAQLEQAFTQTNNSLKERDKLLSTSKNNLAVYAENLQNVGKAAAGAFAPKVLQDYAKAGTAAFGSIIQQINKLQEQKKALDGSKMKTDDVKLYQILLEQLNKELTALYEQMKLTDATNPFAPITQNSGEAIAEVLRVSQSLDQLRQQIGTKQSLLSTETDVTKIASLKQEISALEAEITKINNIGKTGFDAFGNQLTKTANGSVSLRTQLRQMREELARMEEAGLADTASFEKLQQAAGALEDQMSDTQTRIRALASDTVYIDAAIEATTALTAGFGLAQGAASLFGSENQDLAKALQKLQAIMVITNGLQQIGNLIQKQSTLSILTNRGARVAQAAATTVETVATNTNSAATEVNATAVEANAAATATQTTAMEGNVVAVEANAVAMEADTVATEAATTATKGFWATLIATPAGIVLAAIGAIVAIISSLRSETEKATQAQNNLNTELETIKKITDERIQGVQLYTDKQQAQFEAEKASAAEIRKLQIEGLQQQLQLLNSNVLTDKYNAQAEAAAKGLEDMANGKRKYDKNLADSFQKTLDSFNSVRAKADDLQNQYDIAQLNDQKETNIERLKENTAYYEQRLAQTKAGTIAEANARIDLIKAKADEEINSAYHTQTAIAAIHAQEVKDIQDQEKAIRLIRLNNQKQIADDNLILAKEGSKEELQAKLDLLDAEAKISVENANGNVLVIKTINDNFRKQELQLWKAYNYQVAQDAINAQIQNSNSNILELQLQNVSALSSEMIDAKKKLIEQQASLEVLSIDNSEKNEELRKAKIKAVYERELLDKQALEKAKLQAEISVQSNNINSYYQQQNDGLNALAQNFQQFGPARKKLDDDIYKNSAENIARQRQLLEDSYAGGLISFEDYNKQNDDLDRQHNDATAARAEAAYQRKVAAAEYAAATISQIEQSYFQGQIDRLQQEDQQNQDLLNHKLISQNEYNKRKKIIQREEAALQKEQAVFEIVIDFAKKLFEIEAEAAAKNAIFPGLGTAALSQIPLLAAQEGVALALVAARKFKKGKVNIDGPGDEQSDSIPAWLSKGESVINAKATRQHRALLEAINQMQLEPYLQQAVLRGEIKLPEINIPMADIQIPDYVFNAPDIHINPITDAMLRRSFHKGAQNIDYDKLATKIAEALVAKQGKYSDVPRPYVNVDEDGLHVFLEEKNKRTEYVNKRYFKKG